MGGEATLWEASLAMGATDEALRQKFISQVDQVYLEMLEMHEGGEADLEAVARMYQQTVPRDYFRSETGRRLREKILSMRGTAR